MININNMKKEFIEKINIFIKEFLYIDKEIEIGSHYVGKNKDNKRCNLKYKCCCGEFIIHGRNKQPYNNITMYKDDPIFSLIYQQRNLEYDEFIEYIENNMETIFKIKYNPNPNSKNTIINHKYCKKCIIYKNKLMIDIQQELLDKKIYTLYIDGFQTERYGYCKGFDKGVMKKHGIRQYTKCCNENGVKISIINTTWNILPINDLNYFLKIFSEKVSKKKVPPPFFN